MILAIGRREGIHESVARDVTAVFKGKSAIQLEALQSRIEFKISGKAEGVDIGYWESLLSQLKGKTINCNNNQIFSLHIVICLKLIAHMARARLRDRHQENLKKKLNILIAEQGVAKTEIENCESQTINIESKIQTDQQSTINVAYVKSDEIQSEYVC
jgi:hypothetical protein